MKRYTSYSTYILIFISMNTIGTNLQARGFFDTLADFFNFLSDSSPHNTQYTLSRTQAENYIDLYIATLHNELRPNASDYDMQRIREKTYTNAFSTASADYIWINDIRMYNKDRIDQFLLSAIVEVVEANTYNYAYSQTNNSTIASKITQTIRYRLMKVIEKKYTFDAYNLRPFFGYPLNQTILKEIAGLLQHYYPSGPSGSSYNYGTTGYTGYTGYTGQAGRTGNTGSTGYTGGW